ncbi:TetR/AcrR family transcriptional regulator [Compostimonas suwonensis]|uniref:AcrR family transcriptional regulator n=1 Tax=Compostimonas suwonensis TaxID=1048394 RepID=A0A2M9BUC8_9MICO|nr:TetR/AcrR family transcriptional regulator [Compostimonas suwonensis]PJJ61543.1 AcrR family transcriptional regulator [Compostimonas suwonensis]
MADTTTPRQRAREATRAEILDLAARQLGEVGAPGLSLRAVAREMGLVSSAIYRYYPSRDALLTDLIIESYRMLGDAATEAGSRPARDDYRGRLAAIVRGARAWALRHPHRFSLIYGSPVPGYIAPQDTIAPASMIGVLIATIVADARAAGIAPPSTEASRAVAPGFERLATDMSGTPDVAEAFAVGVMVWSQLIGHLSFELFGHYVRVVDDLDAYTEYLIDEMATRLGI